MIGTTVSHYRILEKLGEGGMGSVYRASDTRLHRTVALKFMSADLFDSEEERRRLLREARIAAAINHPNVASLLDIHQADGESFLVMEFVEGQSLRAEIGRGPLHVSRVAGLATQIAEGLRAAHRKGFVHRDIKPENIMINSEGTAKITDFGLARHAAGPPESADLSGTVAYMSPEQVRGEPADRATDIWSLGVVMYEMLTGKRPFGGEYPQAVMYSILHEKQGPIPENRPGALGGLGKVIDRCLEKIPAVRYPDADSLLAELRAVTRRLKNPAEGAEKAIAVLTFTDLSPGGDNSYFSEGLTEEIIANLSRMKNLRVVSKTTVRQYDRSGKNAKQVAADLGVQFILEGSVRKRGSDLLITTQLIDAGADANLWSEKYPGTADDIFTIQETVAAKIAKALRVRLTPTEKKDLKRRPTQSAEAYRLYLRGRFHWNRRNKEGLETSIRYFERAIKKDSRFALAWAGLSDAYNLLCEYTTVSRAETLPKARRAIDRAIELDGQLAEARTSLASFNMLYELDWKNAEKEFRLSLYLKPDYATTHHWLAELLLYTGRTEEAVSEITRAMELEPNSPGIARDAGLVHYYLKRFDEALALCEKTLALDRTFVTVHRLFSLVYSAKGMTAEAIERNRLWGELTGNGDEAEVWLAYLHAAAGDGAGARRVLASVRQDRLSTGYHFRALGIANAALGENDTAFRWFDRALAVRSETITSLRIDFKVDSLRSDPRFPALMKKLGLDA